MRLNRGFQSRDHLESGFLFTFLGLQKLIPLERACC